MPRKKPQETPEVLDPELSDYQLVAAHALAYCGYRKGTRTPRGSVTFAAKKAGVTRSAVHDWLNKPAFLECVARYRSEGVYKAYEGLFLGASLGSQAACESLLGRLERDKDPKIRLEKLRDKQRERAAQREHRRRLEMMEREHKNALELIEARARAGLPPEGEVPMFQVVVGEYGDEGFEQMPPQEERH